MLKVDKSPRAPTKIYCKYCNQYVDNNAKSVNMHNSYVNHQIKVARYKKQKYYNRIDDLDRNKRIDDQISEIKKKAEKQHIFQDIYNEKSTLRDEHESQQQNYDIARDLYGDELLDEMLDRKKHQEINKTEAYNQVMQSLVGVVEKKYRKEIAEFKDYT